MKLPDNKTIYLLEQNNRRPLKVFKTLDQAKKTMQSKPSYYIAGRMLPLQGGILWLVKSNEKWKIRLDWPGTYHPSVEDGLAPYCDNPEDYLNYWKEIFPDANIQVQN